MQRYCDPNIPFYPLPQFNGIFYRSTNFYNFVTERPESLFDSTLSSDFAIWRVHAQVARGNAHINPDGPLGYADLMAVRQLDEVSTQKIEEITEQLSQPRQSALPCP